MSKALIAILTFVFLSIIPPMNATLKAAEEKTTSEQLQNLQDQIAALDEQTKELVLNLSDNIKDTIKKTSKKDKEQITCIAKNIYHESRNQSYVGQLAVAQVTLNRSKTNNRTPCKVVYRRSSTGCQFSWVCDAFKDHEGERIAWKESLAIAYASYYNMIGDPTNGATYYYNPKVAKPKWAKKFQVVAMIGDHKFLKDNELVITDSTNY